MKIRLEEFLYILWIMDYLKLKFGYLFFFISNVNLNSFFIYLEF